MTSMTLTNETNSNKCTVLQRCIDPDNFNHKAQYGSLRFLPTDPENNNSSNIHNLLGTNKCFIFISLFVRGPVGRSGHNSASWQPDEIVLSTNLVDWAWRHRYHLFEGRRLKWVFEQMEVSSVMLMALQDTWKSKMSVRLRRDSENLASCVDDVVSLSLGGNWQCSFHTTEWCNQWWHTHWPSVYASLIAC